ncbi:glycosyltransferase family 34 protein [Myriangium duriaei CBS 260.36]|uniref:Glycosyltransferase family 34 protein n=1 Tax=Myriangium duriaei CBS 260.36 TaxID=1168546 RepID=A0A9P4J4Z4_9PEZI|nr:glycosyltransferase family 34 protein [Myriangium duriaei CBS 260.36]
MHFALPPRKTSQPPPYARSSRSFSLRNLGRLQSLALAAIGAVGFLWLLIHMLAGSGGSRSGKNYIPAGTAKAVVVTVFEESDSPTWKEMIMENRRDYASRHGYTTFFANSSDYPLGAFTVPKSWAILPALRHAMTLHPHSTYLFHLSSSAIIMRPQYSLEEHLTSPKILESLMQTDIPVVPPDSVIHTFSHLHGENIDFVISQDPTGLGPGSMIIRTGEWARYFLDAWFDPLYRSYNFQKAERHALEHLVQWHGTILAKMALVPQRMLNSYVEPPDATKPLKEVNAYAEGDFVANFDGCNMRLVDPATAQVKGLKPKLIRTRNDCEKEQAQLLARWKAMVDKEGRS